MKLLLDQNLSHRLIQAFGEDFPGTSHLAEVRLQRADDIRVWNFAKNQGFVILSKDTDFLHLSMLHGHPPKVIYLEIGNCSTDEIATLVNSSRDDIYRFGDDPIESFLILKE